MKRPEKKKIKYPYIKNKNYIKENEQALKDEGYNKCCDDWEKFLPSVDEIEDMIQNNYGGTYTDLAKAIHKRLRGE